MTANLFAPLGENTAPGLYVHIPFCLSRCSYCTFASGLYNADLADRYLEALANELARWNIFDSTHPPSTVFIGGGTPSCPSINQMQKLLSLLPLPDKGNEATCELNPDSVENEKLALLKASGCTRCSFGVQTFSQKGLRLLARRHDAKTAIDRVRRAVEMGFDSINLDLITAWPGQTFDELIFDLRMAVDLGVTHISCYNIMYERGSLFYNLLYNNKLEEKNDGETAMFWRHTEEFLERSGFVHYETSNFARPGFQCRHNINTWKGKEYLGIGASAHSHIAGRRFANTTDTAEYVDTLLKGKSAEVFSECLSPKEKARETAVFWLRLFDGIDYTEFRERTGYDLFELYGEELAILLRAGTVATSDDRQKVFVPKKYQSVLDSILVDLV